MKFSLYVYRRAIQFNFNSWYYSNTIPINFRLEQFKAYSIQALRDAHNIIRYNSFNYSTADYHKRFSWTFN